MIAQATLIEWLTRSGVFAMPLLEQRWTWRRRLRKNALIILPIALVLGLASGWLLRMYWYG
jgi:hypothetical protein